MRLSTLTEGIAIALDSIWANKLRSGLTILGVVIGVSTVMAMASIVNGIRGQIIHTIEVVGPTTVRIFRFFSSTPLNPDQLPREVRIRPPLSADDAETLRELPTIAYASIWAFIQQRLEYANVRTQFTVIYGADSRFMEILGGGLATGRLFTEAEQRTGTPVAVIEAEAAQRVFGQVNPLGKIFKIGGRPFQVIGVYRKAENIFQPPGQEIAAIVPFEAVRRSFQYDETNGLVILAKPQPTVSVDRAMDDMTVALRRRRGLHPGDPNTFDLVTSDQVLGLFNRLTGVFFLVMIVLSSVALMVGGIGVMAIMLVSVTDRTREIGVRKAVGATRREILWQFLVEAATLTVTGGVLGVVLGLGAGQALKSLLRLESAVPIWSAVVATAVSVGIGLVFGLLPAGRAARLDPVEALRHE